MEFSEKTIEFIFPIGKNKFMPEAVRGNGLVLIFIILNDFLEIPWECKNIGMLLFIELHINTHFSISLF